MTTTAATVETTAPVTTITAAPTTTTAVTTTTQATATTPEVASAPTFLTSRVTQPRVEFATAPAQGRDPVAEIALFLIAANAVIVVAAVVWRRRHPRLPVPVPVPVVPRALPPAPGTLPVRVPARAASGDRPRAAIVFEPPEHLGWPANGAADGANGSGDANGNGSGDGASPEVPEPVGTSDDDIMRGARPIARSNL